MLAASSAYGSEVQFNKPFQVVRPTANHTSMLPVPEGLQMLAGHDARISILAVAGPYHSGKSFLLNALAGNSTVFQVGKRTSPETMGIWLCRTTMKASDDSEVWLMDSEGFFGPGVAESYDAKIFTIASLLGGHLVYNTVKVIDQQAVSLLEMLARRAQLFRTRSSAEPSSADAPEFLSVRSFPPLTWVVEDFVQEVPDEHRDSQDAVTDWLRTYLSKVPPEDEIPGESPAGGSDASPHLLERLYSELKVHTLFLPATTREQLQDLSKVPFDELTPSFQTELQQLRANILASLQARQFEGRAMRGPTLERALRFIVQALQRGMFHEMPSLWSTWTSQVADMSLQDSETWYTSLMSQVDSGDDPVPVAEFNGDVEDARKKCVFFYRELLRDFQVSPDLSALQDRMAQHFRHKQALYHERVQRWVTDLVVKAKDVVSRSLAQIEPPVDPDHLRRTAENATSQQIASFSDRLNAFAQEGPKVELGKAAHMPVFSQDPVHQLKADLHAIVSTRELENEREIQQYFKAAVGAAEEAVDTELKANGGRLMGRTRLKELHTHVQSKCSQAFDEKLSKHKWMKVLEEYRRHKALVDHETFMSRMERFKASNEQKLSTHFRTVLDRCTASYRSRKGNMAMPASEPDLESEHRQLSASMRDILDEEAGTGGELKDTESYRGARKQLDTVLHEGYRHAMQKNVELWKVHSDEATRCAIVKNELVMRHCGLVCLFNKVPQVHKATSQRHLLNCFPHSGAGSRMSQGMQMQVFEDWYNKDLAHDSSVVWHNFYLSTLVIGLVVMLLFGGFRMRPNNMVQSPNYHQQFQHSRLHCG